MATSLFLAFSGGSAAEIDTAALLERLDKLEKRLEQVEAENRNLKAQIDFRTERLERVENRAAKAALPGVVPTHASVDEQFSFKVRGVAQADFIGFHEREGGYDYNSGTTLRRARMGFDGTAWRDFKWRLEAEFAGNSVSLLDAYVAFAGIKPWLFTVGQHKAPYSLEANNTDAFNVFLERGMVTNAFGNPGAERRIGASSFYGTDTLTFGVGWFGDNESISRTTQSPDESSGVNARATWAPIFEPNHILHVGAAGYYRSSLKDGTTPHAVRFSDRPGVRVDGGNLADSGVIANADALSYLGAEAVYIRGPLTLAGEYGRVEVDRRGVLDEVDFDGYYVFGSWFLTGESRPMKTGLFDRVKPVSDFDWAKRTWGAWELALRYDTFDFGESPVVPGHEGDSVTLGVNWYLNPNLKFLLNYVRFDGERTPLDPVGNRTEGDAVGLRLHLDW